MRQLFFILTFIGLCQISFAQDKNEPYSQEWKKADSLLNGGFPESAAKISQSIYDRASQKGQQVQMMKAQLYLISVDFQRSEEAYQDAIRKAEQNGASASFPNNAIWQSIAGQLYWTYYQQNRWRLLDRTRTSGEVTISDFEQWDASRFFERASALYLASLSRSGELEKINIEQYEPILVKGKNTRNLRPTLFDLLAFRALEYFQNDEKDITRPAFSFTMNEAKAFAPAKEFMKYSFPTKDTSSLQWHALKLYQRILTLHSDDEDKDAFIDADLQRLEFAYNKSVHPDKKELYRKALELIEEQYSSNPLSALASLWIAQVMLGTEKTRMDYDQPLTEVEKKPTQFRVIRERLERIIAKFPKSEGGIRASQLLQQILAKDINIVTEEVVLPGEPSKILINYRNVRTGSLRLVRLDNSDNKWLGSYNGYSEPLINDLLALPQMKEWSTTLPASEDYERHSTEIKIDALPVGTYAIIFSANESFSKNENIISYAIFQASGLSSISANNGSGYVLYRKTGAPVANASIDFYHQRYNDNIKGYMLRKTSTVSSNSEGLFEYTGDRENTAIRIRSKKDTVLLTGYFQGHIPRQDQQPQVQTFFFTDRAIYRPGQTIFFKGIMLRKEDNGKKNNVIAGQQTEAILYDVNGQKVEEKTLTTNEFGSFTGSFTAPQGLLTGNMRISNNTGTVDFSVEEYKRPKFAARFDTLTKAFALNETISVHGTAVAYAGNTIDNATVKYRVVRNTRFPYWWYAYRWGFPRSPEMEITSGNVQTDKDGKFIIDFKAIPDPEVNPASLPVFSYSVTADVTDINGETRTGNTMISVGYTSLQLSVNMPKQARPEDLDSINIMSRNLNDQFVATEVKLSIARLKAPINVLRKRLWSVPDQFVMDSLTFKKHFPNDVYRDEDNHLKWSKDAMVFEKSITATKEGMVLVPMKTWERNGWYVIEIATNDKNDKPITEKKYVQVWSEANEGKTNEALVVMPQSQSREPGTEARVIALSGFDQLHLLRQVQDMSNEASISKVLYTGDPLIWTRQIAESDRGGVAVTYITVKENRVYAQQSFINVPWSNKELSISWETHRDKLEPGAPETWTMVIKGNKKERVAAEMVATLYDASLDAFRPHEWKVYGLFPSLSAYVNWNTTMGFGQVIGRRQSYIKHSEAKYYQKEYDHLRLLFMADRSEYLGNFSRGDGVMVTRQSVAMASDAVAAPSASGLEQAQMKAVVVHDPLTGDEDPKTEIAAKDQPLRKNLQETAFFFPQLKTDADGNIRIEFAMPEALTEWKMMAFAHTKDMSSGMIEGSVKTQKDLMVMPNLPRFLRQGDEITISAKISNLSDRTLMGAASLEIVNPMTGQLLNLPFRLQQKDINFSVDKGQSTTTSWILHVPESLYEPVSIRIRTVSGSFTDGEENIVPVITNRMLVTETLPLWINGNGSKNFSFDKLKHSDTSKTLAHHALTLEYTGNPAWLAVQSLPYLMEYPYECAEQVFNRYYATALAAHIVAQSPKIKAIFDKWKMGSSLSSFASPLENNQELKSALLEETPWVMEAKNESEQRKRLGRLFDTYKLAQELEGNARKLKDMQLPDGSFPWFKGMRTDRFITQYIVTGLGRLQQLGIKHNNSNDIIARALPYLDRELKNSYDLLVRSKAKLDEQHLGYTEVQYLYMRSFFSQAVEPATNMAFYHYKAQATKHWSTFNPYMKGMIALALYRNKDPKTPAEIIQSLKETAIKKEEMGMYWMQRGYSYWWHEVPIEAQALLIECFKEVAKDNTSVDAMKVWLLKNKQTQSWETTKATADACYALLLTGSDWLANEPKVTIQLGSKTFNSSEQVKEAGTGYFKAKYQGKDVSPQMGDIKLTVTDNASSTSWGAVYWQYFEDLDKISSAKTPLQITKELFVERTSSTGPELHNITSSSGSVLKVGDKIIVRIQVVVDRDMEYVHLKDMRASSFEPVNVISAYKWQGGLGYYESTKDVSTNFFFDHLRKGKYVFEYPVFVQQKGDFSDGIATIQCMYAPEFSSHSEGIRVQVK